MGYYIQTVIVFSIGNTIRKAVVTVKVGNYIHGVIVLEGSLFSREYNMVSCMCIISGNFKLSHTQIVTLPSRLYDLSVLQTVMSVSKILLGVTRYATTLQEATFAHVYKDICWEKMGGIALVSPCEHDLRGLWSSASH